MRIIDLHCYPGTTEWIACQGPYVEALAKYWKRDWVGKRKTRSSRSSPTPASRPAWSRSTSRPRSPRRRSPTSTCTPCGSATRSAIIQCWGAVEPAKGEIAIRQARKAVRTKLGFIGFHFHPIMQHFAVNDRRYYPLFEVILRWARR